MRKLKPNEIIFLLVGAVLALLSIDALSTHHISRRNTAINTGTFRMIREIHAKGDVSYELYTNESVDYLKIAADHSKCFYYDNFKSKVSPGDTIQIGTMNHFFSKTMVVSLSANKVNYINADCVNEEIDQAKTTLPFVCGAVILVGLLYFRYKKEHSK
jgi:hypothetical protein